VLSAWHVRLVWSTGATQAGCCPDAITTRTGNSALTREPQIPEYCSENEFSLTLAFAFVFHKNVYNNTIIYYRDFGEPLQRDLRRHAADSAEGEQG